MTANTGINPKHLQKIISLFQKIPSVKEAVIFGSRAKGNYRDGSDIDIALKGQGISANELAQIETAYEKLYFPWKLDLVIYDLIENQNLREHIDRVGIPLH